MITLAERMKAFYESVSCTRLLRRMPVSVRLDGKAFHSFTRNFQRPFDPVFRQAMNDTMLYLCENMQGCVLGYSQSDEITCILIDYQNLETEAWFNYSVQKICSISASMATYAFNRAMSSLYESLKMSMNESERLMAANYDLAKLPPAFFDSRCFNIPKEEVANLIFWRQQDATRNSIQLAAQTYFSQEQLQNKSCDQLQEMLWSENGINWNNYDTMFKRGSCCVKSESHGWVIDAEIPIFRGEGRQYIEKLIYIDEDLSTCSH